MSFAVLRRIPLGSFARVGRLAAPSAQMVVRSTVVQGRFLSSTPEPTNGGNKDSFDQVLRKALKDKPELEEFIAEVEHSTGLEREELIRTAEGDPAYGDTYLSGPFGTLQKPVIVKSHFDSRIVVQGRFLSSTPEPTNGGNKDSFDQVLRKALKDKPELEEFIAEVEHSTGLEREELIRTAEGDPAYGDTYLSGPFGTLQKPVIVKSHFDSRIVGCVGGAGDEGHDLLWHEVSADKMTICAECGQVFKLEKVGGNDDHHH
eukprot:TRINITY_DN707_c0_g1_i1.p1 TRINITY_DN707_c0_g1~~TRINITY_DN707_c0_g1_i1.p1  ORF type:complete len:282 (+),score=108.19 TRINITY_DN707_c0_g1_i1:68-847(+)